MIKLALPLALYVVKRGASFIVRRWRATPNLYIGRRVCPALSPLSIVYFRHWKMFAKKYVFNLCVTFLETMVTNTVMVGERLMYIEICCAA